MIKNNEIFTTSLVKQRKVGRIRLIWLVFKNIVRTHYQLFLFNTFLAIITAVINFNIRLNLKEAFAYDNSRVSIFDSKFNFTFQPFGKLKHEMKFWPFFLSVFFLAVVGKLFFSFLHYY